MQIPVFVEMGDLEATLNMELTNGPVAQGETGWVSAEVLVNEKTFFEEPRQIVEVPYRAAECTVERVPRQITERLKVGTRTIGCALNPFKWGSCIEDVFEDQVRTVFDDVTTCIPEQLEVVKTVMTPVVKWNEEIFPTSVNVRYRADILDLALSGSGNRIEIDVELSTDVLVDVQQGFLGEEITIRGALNCDAEYSAQVSATVDLVEEENDVRIAPLVSEVDFDIEELCVPGAVEAIDIALYSEPMSALMGAAIDNAIDKKLKELLNDALAKDQDELTLSALSNDVISLAENPIDLGGDIWLELNPTSLSLAPVSINSGESGQELSTGIGLSFFPLVTIGSPDTANMSEPLSFDIGENSGIFELSPLGVIPLSAIESLASEQAARLLADEAPDLSIGDISVEVYQGTDSLVFGVKLEDVGFWNNNGAIYLTGTPVLDEENNQLYFEGLTFDLASDSFLVEKAAWALEDRILERMEQELRFEFDSEFQELLARIAKFEIPTEVGQLSGTVDELSLVAVGIEGQNLLVQLLAAGKIAFQATIE